MAWTAKIMGSEWEISVPMKMLEEQFRGVGITENRDDDAIQKKERR